MVQGYHAGSLGVGAGRLTPPPTSTNQLPRPKTQLPRASSQGPAPNLQFRISMGVGTMGVGSWFGNWQLEIARWELEFGFWELSPFTALPGLVAARGRSIGAWGR